MTDSVLAGIQLKDTDTRRQFKSSNGHGRSFLYAVLPQVTEVIQALRDAGHKQPRTPLYTSAIETLDVDVVGLIVLIVCLDSFEKPMSKVTLAKRVADYLLQEINYNTLDAANPGLIEGIRKHRKASHRTRLGVEDAIKGGEFGENIKESLVVWELNTKHAIGMVLLESLVRIGLLQTEREPGSRTDKFYWSHDVLAWATDTYDRQLMLSPAYFPLTARPYDYAPSCTLEGRRELSNHSYGPEYPPVPFSVTGGHKQARRDTVRTASVNYKAANQLAQVPYEINQDVYDVMVSLWKAGESVGNLPCSQPPEIPPYPRGGTEDDKKEWKSLASKLHIEAGTGQGQRLYTMRQLALIGGFTGKDLYFIWQSDRRGRLYPVATTLLNPQGHDLSKGLLKFSKSVAKPLGEQGLKTLKISCASHYGYDKVSLTKRVSWSEDNQELIKMVAAQPLGEGLKLWRKADSPFQFLAACMELTAALESGTPTDYESSYICYQDGKCSGAQHWAAHLRDSDVGSSVGLTPSTERDNPPDLYTEILIALMESLDSSPPAAVREGTEGFADWWGDLAKQGLLTRSLVKPPTMTYVYGSVRSTWANQIYNWAKESGIEGHPYEDEQGITRNDLYKRCAFLSGLLEASLDERLNAVVVGMKWMKKAAKAITKVSDSISWRTPGNLIVQQTYRKLVSERLDIRSKALNIRVQQSVQTLTHEVDKAGQVSALSPNYIHSMDATHLSFVVEDMSDKSLPISVIHDSFGCLAADTGDMMFIIKDEWSELYGVDQLRHLRDSWARRYPTAELPPLPPLGPLKASDVRRSSYAFSS